MLKVRCKQLIGSLFFLLATQFIATSLWAETVYSSAVLNEANSLVNIVPKQAKQLVEEYLSQRILTNKNVAKTSTPSRDKADNRHRTPGGTIDALRILSRAEFNLGRPIEALKPLKQAKFLAQHYQLSYLLNSIKLAEIKLDWQIDDNSNKALQAIDKLSQNFSQIDDPQPLSRYLKYQIKMLKAAIASSQGDIELATQLYRQAKSYVDNSKSTVLLIEHQTTVGKHLLANKKYNLALSHLLSSYWTAIEIDSARQLAEVNQVLGQLFYQRHVLDKANDYFSQAADFYDNFDSSPLLAPILKRMGDIYYHQGRYNLALVHYFNAMDHEESQNTPENLIEIRLSLAKTYLQLVNFPLAEQYLEQAKQQLQSTVKPNLTAQALLLEAGLAHYQTEPSKVLTDAKQALEIALQQQNLELQQSAYQLIYLGNELNGDYQQALQALKKYNQLTAITQHKFDLISEDAFRQHKEFAEQNFHLKDQQRQLENSHNQQLKYQKITYTLFAICGLLFIFILRRGHVINQQKEKINTLNKDLYTHSRSGLKNLRMLNTKLPVFLEESGHRFDQWHIGELIHEPLNDRLRFVMVDMPFLRNVYLEHGYQQGLELERAFGNYLKTRVEPNARIYHFSDANLLYIAPNNDPDSTPDALFKKLQQWVIEFEPQCPFNRIIRIGMADYPFLPKAYTAINDKELIDLLLMSASTARALSLDDNSSQWVYLKAIENAPAASLASGNIRQACNHAINQGLIKVYSSFDNEDILKQRLREESPPE